MPIPWKVLGGTVATGGTCTLLSFFYVTRDIQLVPLPASDSIFHSELMRSSNPNGNPTIHDLFVKRVPLSQINPAFLQDSNRLLQRYCGGVWAGLGKKHQVLILVLYIYIYF
jgi:hypothetical protein